MKATERKLSKHGLEQERRILECLRESPKTDQGLADALNMGRSNVTIYLRRMHNETPRRVYVHDYQRSIHGKPKFIWGVGDKVDAEFILNRCPTPRPTTEIRIKQVLFVLAEKPMSVHELAAELHLTVSRIRDVLQVLKDRTQPGGRRIRIAGWVPPTIRGPWTPLYAPGNATDKRCPKVTRSQRYRAYIEKIGGREGINALRRTQSLVKRMKNNPASIFGPLGL